MKYRATQESKVREEKGEGGREGGRVSTVSFRLKASSQQKESLEPPPRLTA